MKKQRLSKKDIKEQNEKIRSLFGIEEYFSKKDAVETISFAKDKYVITKDNTPEFIQKQDLFFPSLKSIIRNNFLPKVIVDMNAIPFVTKGADIMRPGITHFDDNIKKDQIVSICDETHNKPLAIGIAIDDKDNLQKQEKGRSVKNIHFIGDKIWKEGIID